MIISGMSISRSMKTMTLSVPVNGAGYSNTNRKQSELLRFSFLYSNFINSRDKKSNSSSVTFTCMSLTSILVYIYRVYIVCIFVESSVFSERYDLIVSNPPYIKSADLKSLQPEISRYVICV